MKRRSILIALFMLTTLAGCTDERFVFASSGLRVRESPDLSSASLTVLPPETRVEVLETSEIVLEVEGKSAPWVRIEYEHQGTRNEGWAFSGFLTDDPALAAKARACSGRQMVLHSGECRASWVARALTEGLVFRTTCESHYRLETNGSVTFLTVNVCNHPSFTYREAQNVGSWTAGETNVRLQLDGSDHTPFMCPANDPYFWQENADHPGQRMPVFTLEDNGRTLKDPSGAAVGACYVACCA